jgi:hypothetical protein
MSGYFMTYIKNWVTFPGCCFQHLLEFLDKEFQYRVTLLVDAERTLL